MLSHALGTTKATNSKYTPTTSLPVKHVVNEEIHDLSSRVIAKRDETPVDSCMFNLEKFVSCVPPDLWDMLNLLTLSTDDKLGRKQSEAHAHERKVKLHTLCV